MSITTEQYERISRFLDADMTLGEMEQFEQELQQYPEMRDQLDFEQSVRNSFAQKNTGKKTPRFVVEHNYSFNRGWWAAAAAIILLVVIIEVSNPTKQPPAFAGSPALIPKERDSVAPPQSHDKNYTAQQVFYRYFKKDTIPSDYPLALADPLEQYAANNYQPLQQLDLQEIAQTRGAGTTDNQTRTTGSYYKAQAYLLTGKTEQAIFQFIATIQPGGDKQLMIKARWYLALAYLKKNDMRNAALILDKLAANTQAGNYQGEAAQLLQDLHK